METKNKKAISTIIAVTVAISILVAFSATASATTVCPGGTCDYTTIQAAIDAANSGDTIKVAAGTYNEQITIDGVNVSLIAEEGAIIQPTTCGGHKDVIEIYNSVATVEGFTIDANYGTSGCLGGIYARGICRELLGTVYEDDPVDLNAVDNNIFNYGKNGITANGELATAIIEGNTVTGRGVLPYGDWAQNGIQLGWEASGIIRGNTVSDHYWDGCSQPGKTGCTPWVATGILLYEVEGNLGQNALIKAENTFENNQFDVLRVLIPGPPEGNDEAPIQGRAPCDSVEQGIELPPYCGCLNEVPEPYAFQIGQEIGHIGGESAVASKQNNAQAEELDLLENAVEVAPGVFYLGKAMDNGNVVEGYAFVHYEKSGISSKPVGDDTADIYKFMYGGIKWADTMQYEVNPAGSGWDNQDALMQVLTTSLETWDSKTSFELFNDTLETTDETSVADVPDYINRIVWIDFGGPGAIAMNTLWFIIPTKEIVESDVVFNSNYTWANCTTVDCTPGVDVEDCTAEICMMDLQNIATHEFGHNGLGDLYNPQSMALTMYGYGDFEEIHARTLGTGDILGIQALYGE